MKRIIVLIILATAIMLCGCIGTTQEKKSKDFIEITPNCYKTVQNGVNVEIKSTETEITADAPSDKECRTITIAVDVVPINDVLLTNIESEIELPVGWTCTVIEGHYTEDYSLPYIFRVTTEKGGQFLGYDTDGNGIADGYHYRADMNFDGVNYEQLDYDKIYGDGATPGLYKVKFNFNLFTKSQSIEYEVKLT